MGNNLFANENKLDASELVFFQRQVEQIKQKAYDKKYPALKARSLISPDGIPLMRATNSRYSRTDISG